MAHKQLRRGGRNRNFNHQNKGPSPRHRSNDRAVINDDLSDFECPICTEIMTPPIYVCESGHSICHECCKKLIPPVCPFCQAQIKQTRNFTLESLIEKTRIPCPNQSSGCKYTMMQGEMNKHVDECIFRTTDCVFGSIFGKCSWAGPIQSMLAHCKLRHAEITNKIKVNSEIVMNNFKLDQDERILELVEVGSHLCYYHFKVDTINHFAYWAIQFLGTADFVKNWIYEVHIFNKSEPDRKVKFVEECKPDNVPTKAIFESGECAMLPLNSLKAFIDFRGNLIVKIFIKRIDDPKKKRRNNQQNNNQQN